MVYKVPKSKETSGKFSRKLLRWGEERLRWAAYKTYIKDWTLYGDITWDTMLVHDTVRRKLGLKWYYDIFWFFISEYYYIFLYNEYSFITILVNLFSLLKEMWINYSEYILGYQWIGILRITRYNNKKSCQASITRKDSGIRWEAGGSGREERHHLSKWQAWYCYGRGVKGGEGEREGGGSRREKAGESERERGGGAEKQTNWEWKREG